ncbi:MAG: DUF507 family protein [Myxococcales bacterium]|nr:DUF507 family protein [Myxococcales bacterium]
MKLYSAKVPIIARDIIRQLTSAGQIEVTDVEEAELDIQSVLKEYIRRDRELTEAAKDVIEKRGLSHGQFGKVKRMLADQRKHGLGEEGIIWMCGQISETFMQSKFIEEIFATDVELRKSMTEILRRHMMVDEELDEEVRAKIRNLQEGTSSWDVEYAKVMEQIKRRRGLASD